jgi:hypothetical protein
VDPFFGLDSTSITETHLLHRCAEEAVDDCAREATEGNWDRLAGYMTRRAGERGGSEAGNERGANRGRGQTGDSDAS